MGVGRAGVATADRRLSELSLGCGALGAPATRVVHIAAFITTLAAGEMVTVKIYDGVDDESYGEIGEGGGESYDGKFP